ncbi:MAG: tRNA lysidine(34) synthetase TilS, partial [Clostridia bacterium]|nr:tRNA lysidine(34) synthetase TilS [Clostridia bacterium]
ALRGIGGIPPVRDGYIVRPLLCLSSDEIRRVCAAEGIPYVNDSTNGEVLYTRNRIRHLVVPELKRINPKAADVVLSLARSAASVDEYLTKTAEALIEEHPAAFPRSLFCALDPALASYVVTGLYSKTASEESLSSSHIDSLLKAMREGASGIMHLPGNVSAYYGRTLGFIVEKNKKAEYPFRLDLSFGENPVDKCGFSVGMYRPGEDFGTCGDNIYKELIYKITLNDKIKNSLFIRNRADSDTYYFGGHHRKLKKLLCDTGIPRYRRDRLPVLCDGEGIVWVPGFPQRDGTLPSDEKDAKYVITYSETEGDAGND